MPQYASNAPPMQLQGKHYDNNNECVTLRVHPLLQIRLMPYVCTMYKHTHPAKVPRTKPQELTEHSQFN